MSAANNEDIADRIEARTSAYVHRARRMALDLFGPEAGHDQTTLIMQLAIAMIQMEAAERIAGAERTLIELTDDGEN